MRFLKILFILTLLYASVFASSALAQVASTSAATQSAVTNITVTVSGNIMTLSGFIAPFASVVLSINGTVISSTVADSNGNFSFTNIAVAKATSSVCLNSVDFKKLGESEACIGVVATNGIISKANVFLPPTCGVQRTDVLVGNSAIGFGYGMPGATITVHINDLSGCVVTADTTGYYECNIVIQKEGDNTLFADAVLKGKPSEQQLKKILIKGLAFVKPTTVPTQLPAVPPIFTIPWWLWLLLVLIAIILIIILLRRYRPSVPTVGVPQVRLNHLFDFLKRKRKLHHAWMKGVGY